MKEFDLASVLSITTHRLLGDIDIVYDILSYMIGDNLFTHQLIRAGKICRPILLDQFPQLKARSGDEITTDNWQEKLNEYKAMYGDSFNVMPLLEWEHKNPINEVIEMMEASNG